MESESKQFYRNLLNIYVLVIANLALLSALAIYHELTSNALGMIFKCNLSYQPIFVTAPVAFPPLCSECCIPWVLFPVQAVLFDSRGGRGKETGRGSGCVTYSFCFCVSFNSFGSHHSFARTARKSGGS